MRQHLANPAKNAFRSVRVVIDDTFNMSARLDHAAIAVYRVATAISYPPLKRVADTLQISQSTATPREPRPRLGPGSGSPDPAATARTGG